MKTIRILFLVLALLACQPLLQAKMHTATDTTDERMAYFILCHAVEAPIRALLENAGYNLERTLGKIALDGTSFDFTKGQV